MNTPWIRLRRRGIDPRALGAAAWHFPTRAQTRARRQWQDAPRLGERARIIRGVITGCDAAYWLASPRGIERRLLRPVLRGRDLHGAVDTTSSSGLSSPAPARNVGGWLIVPYERCGTTWRLIPPSRLQRRYPNAWRHLRRHRAILKRRRFLRRRRVNKPAVLWYAYEQTPHFAAQRRAKIIVPRFGRWTARLDAAGRYWVLGAWMILPRHPAEACHPVRRLKRLCRQLQDRAVLEYWEQTASRIGTAMEFHARLLRAVPLTTIL